MVDLDWSPWTTWSNATLNISDLSELHHAAQRVRGTAITAGTANVVFLRALKILVIRAFGYGIRHGIPQARAAWARTAPKLRVAAESAASKIRINTERAVNASRPTILKVLEQASELSFKAVYWCRDVAVQVAHATKAMIWDRNSGSKK
eukprot:gnl/MRDRNA2_/MRDRNA2_35498_c0_seq1.p1 gnl/MRDRNA2_/MRDRNA2_35498_c0~~gnl/MRDRNA2_/MRDRNA2_35498_c0_seq1.p1  ORF type:complete len:149 (+),score=17.15 gnl/MRDRNA2_/MRDRNA2_35498_c0_seq1:136-582(+)